MLFYLAKGCPNCGGLISDERLSLGLPCPKCLPSTLEFTSLTSLLRELKSKGTLKRLKKLLEVEEAVSNFTRLFKELFRASPTSLQINWVKRLFLGESFAILAPTGTGKTTFGLLASLLTPGKVLIILPTRMLVKQVEERLSGLLQQMQSLSLQPKGLLSYQGNSKEKELLQNGDFDIFVCTINFIHRNFSLFQKLDFSLIFIDDVDSLLKSGKNVEQIFKLLGFSEREISLALKREKEEDDYARLQVIREKHQKEHKQIIVSSATLRPKTNRVLLFQNLLGFEVTRFVSTLRRVEDTYILCQRDETKEAQLETLLQRTVELCQNLGKGGLVFLEEGFGREGVKSTEAFLRAHGLNCASYLSLKEDDLLSGLREGNLDVVVGLAHLANPFLRGIDLPDSLKYVIFVGVPRHLFLLSKEKDRFALEESPATLYHLLLNLLPLFAEEERIKALSYLSYLKRYLTMKAEDLPQYESLYQKVLQIKTFLEEKLSDPPFIEKLRQSEEVYISVDSEGRYFIVVGNVQVYLQGSGRVSRLTAKGLLPGLSIILVDNPKALRSLEKRLRFYLGNYDWQGSKGAPNFFREIKREEASQILKKIEEERSNLESQPLDFKNFLLIVESPHKAKSIANFFGKPSVRRLNSLWVYEIPLENVLLSICASLGHVFNLVKREGIFGVQQEDRHFYPIFNSIKVNRSTGEQLVDEEPESDEDIIDKWTIVEDLQRLAYCTDGIFIASDPDAEGEKIAYDLYLTLRPFQAQVKRLEFHEVTPKALKEALAHPQNFNFNRVKAQLARRVADRWVGFTLSQELWKVFNRQTLSAGRVQSPVLGWIISRAEEAKESKYLLSFLLGEERFSLELEDEALAKKVYEELPSLTFQIVETITDELSPPPPYTTDSILEEAFYYLRFPTSKTMNLLQELFELGLITYHRTDSTTISEVGRFQVARPYIVQNFGEDYFTPREWASPGAHEGIRPTNPWDVMELKLRVAHGLISLRQPRDSFRLYELIFKRFMASQMKKVKVEKGTLLLKIPSYEWKEKIILEVKASGYDELLGKIRVFNPHLEPIKIRDLKLQRVPKAFLFNQGTLIQEMKKRGLGRPSTYAEIVSTLLARGYVYELKSGGLVPTSLGKKVYAYLAKEYSPYIAEEFTKQLEEFMDTVEEGKANWEEICQMLLPLLREGKIIS